MLPLCAWIHAPDQLIHLPAMPIAPRFPRFVASGWPVLAVLPTVHSIDTALTQEPAMNTPAFQVSSIPARASFLAMALVITASLLASVGQVADRQYDAALLAQAQASGVQIAASAVPAAKV